MKLDELIKEIQELKAKERQLEYLDTINDPDDMRYDDCKMHSLCGNGDWYRKILKEVLKLPEKPK